MSRRLALVILALLVANGLGVAPVACSESSEGSGPSCDTVFGYPSPLR